MRAIKVINAKGAWCVLDLDTARHTLRRNPCGAGVEGSGGLPVQLKLPNRQNTRQFVKIMHVLRFKDAAMVSESMSKDLFDSPLGMEQLPVIAMFCNDAVMSFIKTLAAKTPDHILSFIQIIGDDGDYKWIAQTQVNELFSTFMDYKKSDPKKLESISPHFKAYVFEHSENVEIPKLGRKRLRLP
jgi:hypothetical protein